MSRGKHVGSRRRGAFRWQLDDSTYGAAFADPGEGVWRSVEAGELVPALDDGDELDRCESVDRCEFCGCPDRY